MIAIILLVGSVVVTVGVFYIIDTYWDILD